MSYYNFERESAYSETHPEEEKSVYGCQTWDKDFLAVSLEDMKEQLIEHFNRKFPEVKIYFDKCRGLELLEEKGIEAHVPSNEDYVFHISRNEVGVSTYRQLVREGKLSKLYLI